MKNLPEWVLREKDDKGIAASMLVVAVVSAFVASSSTKKEKKIQTLNWKKNKKIKKFERVIRVSIEMKKNQRKKKKKNKKRKEKETLKEENREVMKERDMVLWVPLPPPTPKPNIRPFKRKLWNSF